MMPASGAASIWTCLKGIAQAAIFSGTQSLRISQLLEDGLLEIGAIHLLNSTRLYVDLSPNVALIAGYKADRKGCIPDRYRRYRRWWKPPPSTAL